MPGEIPTRFKRNISSGNYFHLNAECPSTCLDNQVFIGAMDYSTELSKDGPIFFGNKNYLNCLKHIRRMKPS